MKKFFSTITLLLISTSVKPISNSDVLDWALTGSTIATGITAGACVTNMATTFSHELSHATAHKLLFDNFGEIHIGTNPRDCHAKKVLFRKGPLTIYKYPFFKEGFHTKKTEIKKITRAKYFFYCAAGGLGGYLASIALFAGFYKNLHNTMISGKENLIGVGCASFFSAGAVCSYISIYDNIRQLLPVYINNEEKSTPSNDGSFMRECLSEKNKKYYDFAIKPISFGLALAGLLPLLKLSH